MRNNKYTVVIIDDETICIQNLLSSLSEYPELFMAGTAQTTDKGKALILEQRPDLLFLDVELPEQSGLELLTELRDEITWPMQVVFYTAYEKYLLEALRVSAFDYLLKPYEQEEIQLVLNHFFHQVQKDQSADLFHNSIAQLNPANHTYLIATITGFQKLRLDQIGYFEYQQKQWLVILTDQSRLQLRRTTKAEDILNYSSTFIQINQKQIINIDYLSTVDGKTCRLFPPFHKEISLIISRAFLKAIQERYEMI